IKGKHLLLVSSQGADASSFFFYNKTKGEIEAALRDLKLKKLTIVRPSLLLGQREEKRSLEAISQTVMPLLVNPFLHGNLKKFRAVSAADVATLLLDLAISHTSQSFIETRIVLP